MPATAEIRVFVPGHSSIPSAGVKDMINGAGGEVILATDRGLAVYADGSWQTIRPSANTSEGLISEMVLAVEFDPDGRLWIGTSAGLQIVHGDRYETVRDQHLLKNLCINDLIRRGGEIWIATGRAGLHRYAAGTWTWFKPHSANGPGCSRITGMAVDHADDTLLLASDGEGVWVLNDSADQVRFLEICYRGEPIEMMPQLREDPFGGVYIFNRTEILRYAGGEDVRHVLHIDALGGEVINDVAATPHGMLLVATDRGLYGWNETGVQMHLAARDGLRSNAVKKLYLDAAGRCWFVVPGAVGYITGIEETRAIEVRPATPDDTPQAAPPSPPMPDPQPKEALDRSLLRMAAEALNRSLHGILWR
ncbi:MAG: two-component regulator propeller domain-containing protein [Methanomicrobiaceae archaeon]|nr:two-component regulator propeller domain-containing protein [Methanomicrobiaceae archaeon]